MAAAEEGVLNAAPCAKAEYRFRGSDPNWGREGRRCRLLSFALSSSRTARPVGRSAPQKQGTAAARPRPGSRQRRGAISHVPRGTVPARCGHGAPASSTCSARPSRARTREPATIACSAAKAGNRLANLQGRVEDHQLAPRAQGEPAVPELADELHHWHLDRPDLAGGRVGEEMAIRGAERRKGEVANPPATERHCGCPLAPRAASPFDLRGAQRRARRAGRLRTSG